MSQLNLFAVAAPARIGTASTAPLRTEEHTFAGKTFGNMMERISPSQTAEQRAGRAARHEFAAEIIADTFAMLPGVKWRTAGAFRALFLASEEKGITGFGLDFAQGAALNKVMRIAMPGSPMLKVFERIENKVAREVVTHATVGVGFGVASTSFRPQTWHDKDGQFSIGTGLVNVGKAGLLGGFINVPAGAIGSRIGKMTLENSVARKFALDDAYVLSNITAGTTGGVVFGGTDALLHGNNVWQGMLAGGFLGGLTGGTVGLASRPSFRMTPETLRQQELMLRPDDGLLLRPEDLRAAASDKPGSVAGEKPVIDKVARGKALEMGVDPETYARLQVDMKTREIPLIERVRTLGDPEAITLQHREQKPGAEKHTGDYKTFGEWARDWMVPVETPARIYKVGIHDVIVPEDYARQLDDILVMRRILEQKPATLNKEQMAQYTEADRALKLHPLRDRAHPVDLIPFLEELPDPSLVKRLLLMDRRNPEDPWHRKTYRSDFVSAASAGSDGTMTYYAQNRDLFSRETAYHEWSHLLENRLGAESKANDAAFQHEKAWSPSDYARRDSGERFAEMGASLLHPEADQFLIAAHKAPIGTSIYTSGWFKAMRAAPQDHQSVFGQAYGERIKYVQEKILPVAQENLTRTLATGTPAEQARAARILSLLGTPDNFVELKKLAATSVDKAVSEAAFEAAFAHVQRGRRTFSNYELLDPKSTLEAQVSFLAEMAEGGSNSRYRAMDQLHNLRSESSRARLFHELFVLGNNRATATRADQATALKIVEQIPDTRGKEFALREALRLAPDLQVRTDMTMSAMMKNPSLHVEGLKLLAETPQPRTRPIFEQFAKGSDPVAAEVAKKGLARLGRMELFERAMAGIDHPDANERQVALLELAQSHDNRAIKPLLEVYMQGKTAQEQRMAAELLEQHFNATMWKFEAKTMAGRMSYYGPKLRGLLQGRPIYDGT